MDNQILTGKRFLVVEYDMLILMAIQDTLRDLGCTSVTVAANIESALRCLAVNSFDLATLDVNLVGSLSYPVADALIARHIPFAFSTGYSEQGLKGKYEHHAVLRKPFTYLQFKEIIKNLLAEERLPF